MRMLLLGFVLGWFVKRWDERHAFTWRGRLDWFFRLRCRWFGVHEPWDVFDCVHCDYDGPRVEAAEQRRAKVLVQLGAYRSVEAARAFMRPRRRISTRA